MTDVLVGFEVVERLPGAQYVLPIVCVVSAIWIVIALLIRRRRQRVITSDALAPWATKYFKRWQEFEWDDDLAVRVTPEERRRIQRHAALLKEYRKNIATAVATPASESPENEGCALLMLPNEVALRILSYVDAGSLCTLGRVSRRLRELTSDSYAWTRLVHDRFSRSASLAMQPVPEHLHKDWRRVYATNQLVLGAGGTVRRVAWSAIVAEDGPMHTHELSQFGGEPLLWPGETAPICAKCQHEMTFFVQLDMNKLPDAKLERRFGGKGMLLQLWVCTRNGGCDSEQAFSGASFVRVVPQRRGNARHMLGPVNASSALHALTELADAPPVPAEKFPCCKIVDWEYFVEDIGEYWMSGGPQRSDSVGYYDFLTPALELTPDEKHLVLEDLPFNARNVIVRKPAPDSSATESMRPEEFIIKNVGKGDKLGGWPAAAPGLGYPSCPECQSPMENCVFQVCSEHHLPWMFSVCGVGQILQCPNHPQSVAFRWSIPKY